MNEEYHPSLPSTGARYVEDVDIWLIDMWRTVSEIPRERPYWDKAKKETVTEPVLLVKSRFGLDDPAYKEIHSQIDAEMINFWVTANIGDLQDFLEALAARIYERFGIECKLSRSVVKKLRNVLSAEWQDFRVYDDVYESLARLKAEGKTLILCPNQAKFNSDKFLHRTHLHRYIDKVYWSFELGVAKPDPRYYELVLKDLVASGIISEIPNADAGNSETPVWSKEIGMVDDQAKNLFAARKFGVQTTVRIERMGNEIQGPLPLEAAHMPVIRTLNELCKKSSVV